MCGVGKAAALLLVICTVDIVAGQARQPIEFSSEQDFDEISKQRLKDGDAFMKRVRSNPSNPDPKLGIDMRPYIAATRCRSHYVFFLRRYDLTEELQLTEGQQDQLAELVDLQPADVQRSISDGDFFELPPAEYREFLRQLRETIVREYKRIDEKVEGILNARQLARLKQVICQYYLVNGDPEFALSFSEREVEKGQRDRIFEVLNKSSREAWAARQVIWVRTRFDAVAAVIGQKRLDELFGRVSGFGLQLERYPTLERELRGKGRKTRSSKSPRRDR